MSTTRRLKRAYFGSRDERKDWKSSYRKYSKKSNYKIEKILNCFVRDLSVAEAWEELSAWRKKDRISEKTIRQKYREIQHLFVRGGLAYSQMYGGALAPLLVGVPPRDIQDRINNARKLIPRDKNETSRFRIKPNKNEMAHFDDPYIVFYLERAIREYAWLEIDPLSQLVIFNFAFEKMKRFYGEKVLTEFVKFGIEYIAEANWSARRVNNRMREKELWERIYKFPRRTEDGYYERLFRDMKWLVSRHPLGTRIEKNGMFKLEVKYSVFEEANREWFPNGLLI